jgi:hypothetical protein
MLFNDFYHNPQLNAVGDRAFPVAGANLWNFLPEEISLL